MRMSRSQRLLDLIQSLRRHKRPVTAAALASELGVSLRTIYRDIGTLQGQGASIDGEAGIGYLLRPGFMLPPLMFGDDELEAIVLGLRWVMRSGDAALAAGARHAATKIEAVLPDALRDAAESSGILAGPGPASDPAGIDIALLRRAIRVEQKLRIAYTDAGGRTSERTVWPFALGFFERARVIVAWCETRQEFRHFRADRIAAAEPTGRRYPKRRRALIKEWREREGIPEKP
jgi:predicted DNA-binding transcriptional regulator YafY